MAVCIKELKELPPLSNSAREILKIIHDDDIDASFFAQIVEQDPALLARIISLANSAYFASRAVNDVHRAIVDVLGFRMAKNIALGVVLGGIFNPRHCRRFDLPRYWFLSLLTATLARDCILRLKLSSLDANDAYLSGMLNEIGLLALAYLHPEEMEQVLLPTLVSENREDSILGREIEIFGKNHYEISAQLLNNWHLPDIVMTIMLESSRLQTSHDAEACAHQAPGELCQIIQFFRMIANLIYEQKSFELAELNLPDVLAEQPATINELIHSAEEQVESYREMANLLS